MRQTDEFDEYPESGPWRFIQRSPNEATFYPRDSRRHARYEWTLPSGKVLIDDLHAGFVLRRHFSPRADRLKLKPLGRRMGDRATLRAQSEGLEYFVFYFQERYDADDNLVSEELGAVEVHRGREVTAIIEPGSAAK